MTDDLVQRLREHADRVAGGGPGDATYDPETLALEHEAADEIERLRLIEEELRAAIRGLLRTGTGLSDYQAAAKRAREVLGDE